jgi:hypothetical protein
MQFLIQLTSISTLELHWRQKDSSFSYLKKQGVMFLLSQKQVWKALLADQIFWM